MTDLTDLLTPETVFERLAVTNKKALFQQLAAAAAAAYDLDSAMVVDGLVKREKLGSTGFGGGVATPHARIAGLNQVVGVFAKLAQPIDFQAIDDLPVDMVFLLLSPVDAGALHLKALARVSRRLRERGFVDKLRGAGSRDALYAMLTADEARDAA
ncbi:MAG: transporter subunit IIA-like nitrogen-regulatory protein PtsN [Sphingomonas bacterium]|uniref:PTS sugar transporter subunit IIA n=1 Tax=Sphingomonas bacterium TaxID=1895847 RepID=UPI00261C5F1C|nr:PTS sugar transporter subunit IIA [Sphingomonas bacterium]MDB5704315.1 transporter subunit IIA-like nitrogen-regulatory protein PtsN [Sphingomonas bacterium]